MSNQIRLVSGACALLLASTACVFAQGARDATTEMSGPLVDGQKIAIRVSSRARDCSFREGVESFGPSYVAPADGLLLSAIDTNLVPRDVFVVTVLPPPGTWAWRAYHYDGFEPGQLQLIVLKHANGNYVTGTGSGSTLAANSTLDDAGVFLLNLKNPYELLWTGVRPSQVTQIFRTENVPYDLLRFSGLAFCKDGSQTRWRSAFEPGGPGSSFKLFRVAGILPPTGLRIVP